MTADAPLSWRRESGRALKGWTAVLVLWLLPLDILFRVDTFRNMDVSRIDWLFDACFLILFLSTLAALCAAAVAAALALPCALGRDRAVLRIREINSLLAACFAAYCLMIFGKSWLRNTLRIQVTPAPWLKSLILLAALAAIVGFRRTVTEGLDSVFSKKLEYGLVPLVALSFLVVAAKEVAARRGEDAGRTRPAAPAAAAPPPNVILVTFDALRAADMPAYGYSLDTSPNLTRFAAESHVVERAISNSNWTRPSVASLLTGTYPSRHRLVNESPGNNYLPADLKGRTLPGELRRRGYRTAAIVSNVNQAHPWINDTRGDFDVAPLETISPTLGPRLDRSLYLLGALARSVRSLDGSVYNWIREAAASYFAFLNTRLGMPGRNTRRNTDYRPPGTTFGLAQDYIREQSAPYFLWIHVYPPHWPYVSSQKHRNRFVQGEIRYGAGAVNLANIRFYDLRDQPFIDRYRLRYDENILYADEAFGDFIAFLKASGRYDDALIVVTSDHGDSFERGFWLHRGPSLHYPLIHIPLMIRLPRQAAGKRVRANAEQVDILPTVLDLLGHGVPAWTDGESLKGALLRGEPGAKPKFSMQLEGSRFSGVPRTGTVTVIRGDYKYTRYLGSGRGELFDLSRDPGETVDLSLSEPRIADELKGLILEKLARDARR